MSSEAKFGILLVDDETANIDVLHGMLKPDYIVYVAKSGQAALRRAREDKPDLILLDIAMPDFSGLEVLAILKSTVETREIPVICMAELHSVEDEEKSFFLGAVDYITKPFNSTIVKARVRTHLKILNQIRTIERLGLIDALTGIPNRRCFNHQLHVEWGRATREKTMLSALAIDVDRFKSYNEIYGYAQGDVLLQTLSRLFECSLKRRTDLVARMGGEEFAVLMPNTDLSGALKIAEAIRANVEAASIPIADGGSSTSVTISIGVAVTEPVPEGSLTDFMAEADKALYMAKSTGRNRVCSSVPSDIVTAD